MIQGPPGTGKSYVGLKLIQSLLSLKPKLSGPILVMSYKNHILDQTLENCATLEEIKSDIELSKHDPNDDNSSQDSHNTKEEKRQWDRLPPIVRIGNTKDNPNVEPFLFKNIQRDLISGVGSYFWSKKQEIENISFSNFDDKNPIIIGMVNICVSLTIFHTQSHFRLFFGGGGDFSINIFKFFLVLLKVFTDFCYLLFLIMIMYYVLCIIGFR